MLELFIIDIFIYFPITNHHVEFEVVMVCIQEVMAIQILWGNSAPLGGKGKRNYSKFM